ncbi:Karyopherin (importin) beta 1 [Trachipleistophora hominis]|uniref:Karyopherin (Importin) beta 1 n=1 Tax=Trachipleistophora hominis TaxID=72359 RepID=L7JW85_TRAHO|nr:Karyopherin (importin) beta 1 [Trachipleistophora hominis]
MVALRFMTNNKNYQMLTEDELQTEIITCIPSFVHPDQAKRKEVEETFVKMSTNSRYLYVLSKMYASDPRNYFLTGVLLRNSLMATDPTLKKRIEEKYASSTNKEELKSNLMKMSDDISIDCIARIASLELMKNEWPDFFKVASTRSIVLAILYLRDENFDFSNHLEVIYQRLYTEPGNLLKVIFIFRNRLSTDRLNHILKMCIEMSDIPGLTTVFDNFYEFVVDRNLYFTFVNSLADKQPAHVIKFYEVLDCHQCPFEASTLFRHLESADAQIVHSATNLLCNFFDKLFVEKRKEYLPYQDRCMLEIKAYLNNNEKKDSFVLMLGCCPNAYKQCYLDVLIQKNAFWPLSRLAEQRFDDLAVCLPQIVKCCLIAIDKDVNEDACQLLQVLSQQVDGEQYENELSFCFIDILNTLVLTSERINYTEYEKRAALFNALIETVKGCADSQRAGLEKLLFYLISKVKESLKIVDSLNMNEFLILEDILTYYLSLIEELLRKQKETQYIEAVYDIYYDVLNLRRISSLVGDVYISLSALITEHSFFLGKMDELVQFIVRDIKYKRGYDIFTFKAALLLIGDISQVLSKGILKYSFLTELLLNNLSSEHVQRSVKPVLLSVLGDLVFAMGTSYAHKDLTCLMLAEILRLDRSLDILFIDDLKRSALILLDTLLITFEREIDEGLVVGFLARVSSEDERNHSLRQLLDLTYDYVSIYGVNGHLDVINEIIGKGRQGNIDKTDQLLSLIK